MGWLAARLARLAKFEVCKGVVAKLLIVTTTTASGSTAAVHVVALGPVVDVCVCTWFASNVLTRLHVVRKQRVNQQPGIIVIP